MFARWAVAAVAAALVLGPGHAISDPAASYHIASGNEQLAFLFSRIAP